MCMCECVKETKKEKKKKEKKAKPFLTQIAKSRVALSGAELHIRAMRKEGQYNRVASLCMQSGSPYGGPTYHRVLLRMDMAQHEHNDTIHEQACTIHMRNSDVIIVKLKTFKH